MVYNGQKIGKTARTRRRGKLQLKGRLWVDGKDGTVLSFGRVVLLDRIKRYGSISKAAKSMEMSYRHAWELVDSMNSRGGRPLVITAIGGKNGGGTRVTADGEKAVKTFWDLYKKLAEFLEKENAKLTF
ncbi:MAG: winged helix-turn-helix domain-containing protein [Nitrospinota bacterium]